MQRSGVAAYRSGHSRQAGLRRLTLGACAWVVFAAGCGPSEEERLAAIFTTAATNPALAQGEIVKQWTGRQVTLDKALDLGHARLEKGDPGGPAYALALLNAIGELEGPITRANVNEFFWVRTGTLAGSAGAGAYRMGDVVGARQVVLAGPERWKTEAYWRRHPDHDALASWIMHKSGESGAAVARLRERAEPDEQVTATVQRIQAEQVEAEAARARSAKGR